MCMCVCQCVNIPTTEPVTKFGTGIDLDEISDEFDGQGHRSKVKVIQLKNVILEFWPGLSGL